MTINQVNPLLKMENIHLSYRQVEALKGVDFELRKGEIHALAGAHRAGKSSLVKLLCGASKKNKGRIYLNGTEINEITPKIALENRIGMIYQHPNIIPHLSTIENIFAGQMKRTWYFGIPYKELTERTKALFEQLGSDFNFKIPVNQLTTEEQHMVEFARVLSFDPQVLILDEVSSRMTPAEMKKVYQLMHQLRDKERGIIYITHNIDEIFELSDRVTILNDGHRVDTQRIQELDKIRLIKLTYSFAVNTNELKNKNRDLYYFKKNNENLIKHIPTGVIILDEDHKIDLINVSALKILDLENSNTMDQTIESIFSEKLISEEEQILKHIHSHDPLILEEVHYEEHKILKITILPYRDDDYVVVGTILLLEDTTREIELEKYFLKAEKISSIAELGAGIAHEINNPLGIIRNYVELLKLKENDADSMIKLEKIENEINRASNVVGSLLSFSRFVEVPSSHTNIAEILEEVVLLLDHKFKEKHISISVRIHSEKATIIGDENKLKQLMINILMNSIEAVLDGGRIEAEVDVDEDSNYVHLAITDNGCGIPSAIIDNIYEPFYTNKISKKNTGLGLSICRQIVEMHNGIITCNSAPGQKTRFNIRFPLEKALVT